MWPYVLLFFQMSAHQTALAAYKQHKFDEAVAGFKEALRAEQPGSAEYAESVLLIGQSLYLKSNYKEAIPWLEKATDVQSPLAEACYMLGKAFILTQQADKAVGAFAKLFQLTPASAAAHVVAAEMLLHQDVDTEAAKQAKAALEIDGKIPQAHFILGEIAIMHADIDNAIAELNREIEINPDFAMAHYRLGDAYSRREMWKEAIPALERSVWLNPNYSGPFILLGKGYLKLKELANAEGVLRHALRLDPQNLSAHYLLGQTLMEMGKTEDAKREMDRWKELKGGNE